MLSTLLLSLSLSFSLSLSIELWILALTLCLPSSVTLAVKCENFIGLVLLVTAASDFDGREENLQT